MKTFSHSGDFGDILYSLYFCNDFCKQLYNEDKFNYILTIDESFWAMNKFYKNDFKLSKMIKELLNSQKYINQVEIRKLNEKDFDIINLDNFKKINTNTNAGNIINWYYHLCNKHLKKDFSKPIISFDNFIPDNSFKDKILLSYTYRYVNPVIDYIKLKKFQESIIFIGLPHEYELFKSKYFEVSFYQSNSFIDIAKKMLSSKLVVGNQGGLMSLAECIKCNRILLTAEHCIDYSLGKIVPGPVNNDPIGGWCDIATTTEKMMQLILDFYEN